METIFFLRSPPLSRGGASPSLLLARAERNANAIEELERKRDERILTSIVVAHADIVADHVSHGAG